MGTQPPTPPIEIDKKFWRHSVLPLARAQRQRFDRIFPSVGPSVELQPSQGKDVQNFSKNSSNHNMLSLQNNSTSSLMHPWFARPISGPGFESRPHREHHEFLAVSDESAASTTSTEEQISFYNSYHNKSSSSHKKISENRPRSAQYTYGDFLDLPSGMFKSLFVLSTYSHAF